VAKWRHESEIIRQTDKEKVRRGERERERQNECDVHNEIPVGNNFNSLTGNCHTTLDCDVKITENYLKFSEQNLYIHSIIQMTLMHLGMIALIVTC
jgi:hypothetical protein